MTKYKIYILVFILLFAFSVSMKAEDKRIPIPDNVGKHLFELFQNRVDIKESPFYKVVVLDPESVDYKYQMYDVNADWALLLQAADVENLSVENTSYAKSLFTQTIYTGEYPLDEKTELSVIIKTPDAQLAFKIILDWCDGWKIRKIDTAIYNYYAFELRMSGITFERRMIIDPEEAKLDEEYSYNTTYKYKEIEETEYLTSLSDFATNLVHALEEGAAYGSEAFFMTDDEYNETIGKSIGEYADAVLSDVEMRLQLPASELKRLSESKDTSQSQIIEYWETIMTARAQKYGGSQPLFDIKQTEEKISNEASIETNQIVCEGVIRTILDIADLTTIYYQAVWHNGVWKLITINPYTLKWL